jgi:hypothetical protein
MLVFPYNYYITNTIYISTSIVLTVNKYTHNNSIIVKSQTIYLYNLLKLLS